SHSPPAAAGAGAIIREVGGCRRRSRKGVGVFNNGDAEQSVRPRAALTWPVQDGGGCSKRRIPCGGEATASPADANLTINPRKSRRLFSAARRQKDLQHVKDNRTRSRLQ